jgi:transposase-like protein
LQRLPNGSSRLLNYIDNWVTGIYRGGRRLVPEFYTTNAIESLNMSLRKVTKTRGSFPNDEVVFKLLYLALRNIAKKWTMPIVGWKAALNRFAIMYENRLLVD